LLWRVVRIRVPTDSVRWRCGLPGIVGRRGSLRIEGVTIETFNMHARMGVLALWHVGSQMRIGVRCTVGHDVNGFVEILGSPVI
jgi:hypothetical protein